MNCSNPISSRLRERSSTPGSPRLFAAFLLILALTATARSQAAPPAAQPLPSASNVVDRVLRRVKALSKDADQPKYTYEKRALVEELDSHGKVVDWTEKLYHVELIGGWPYTRLVKVQGEDLTPAEAERENRKEAEMREKVAGGEAPKPREKTPWLSSDLLDKFVFTVVGRDVVVNRQTLILDFHPRPDNPEKTIQDRIVNRFAGRLWVDEEEADIAKFQARLIDELSLGWLGIFGSLKECEMLLDRQRLEDGTWVNKKQTILLIGRKLLSPLRFRSTEYSRKFVKAP